MIVCPAAGVQSAFLSVLATHTSIPWWLLMLMAALWATIASPTSLMAPDVS
jgi:hypothetical protein